MAIIRLALLLLAATLARPDGTAITYYLDRPAARTYPIVAILQGSECLRVSDKYAPFIERLNRDGIAVLRVEKPGLTQDTPIGACPDEYLRLNTLDRRVLDLLAVLAQLRRQPDGWDGRLALVGGSEGGMIAAMSAPLIPETRAVVLLSSGGGRPFADEIAELIAMPDMRATMEEIKKNPVPGKEWLSDGKLARNTWQWWAGALPVVAANPLLQTDAPILVIHGEADRATPVSSAQTLEDVFKQAGRTNLTLRRYPGMGHSPTPEAIEDAFTWLIARLRW